MPKFPGRMNMGNNGPMNIPGMMPGGMPMPQQPLLEADLQTPFVKTIVEAMFKKLVPEDQRKHVLDAIIFPMITRFREQSKETKKANSNNPHFNELVISGQFKQFVEGGVEYIHHLANSIADMELYAVKDVRKEAEPDDQSDTDDNIILP